MKNNINKTLFMIFTGVLIVASCNSKKQDNSGNPENSEKTPETILLKKQDISGIINLPGELKPYEEVNLFARTEGFVKEIFVDRGSEVKKGQILARLEAPEVLARMAESLARVSSAESKAQSFEAGYMTSRDSYERILSTSRTEGAISSIELLRFKNKMVQDSLDYSAALKELDAYKSTYDAMKQLSAYLEILAPFSGIVTERNVHTGALVSPSDNSPLFRMEANQRLRLEIALPEAYSGMSSIGDTVFFTVSSLNNRELKAVIKRQAKSITVRNRVEMIEADISNENHALIGGSFAMVRLKFTQKNVIVVPESAIFTTMQDRFVIRVSGNKAERVPVKKGVQAGNQVEIYGNIDEGDEIWKVALEI